MIYNCKGVQLQGRIVAGNSLYRKGECGEELCYEQIN